MVMEWEGKIQTPPRVDTFTLGGFKCTGSQVNADAHKRRQLRYESIILLFKNNTNKLHSVLYLLQKHADIVVSVQINTQYTGKCVEWGLSGILGLWSPQTRCINII